LLTNTWASSAGVAKPPAIGRSGAGACTTISQVRQAYLRRVVRVPAQLRRNPIQHLAHALSDDMQRAAAAGAEHALNLEPDLFARQMAGQWFATRRPFPRLLFARRTLLLLAGEMLSMSSSASAS
jgi:hypothetical protein